MVKRKMSLTLKLLNSPFDLHSNLDLCPGLLVNGQMNDIVNTSGKNTFLLKAVLTSDIWKELGGK